jgi:predicted dehydrogenase
VATPPSSHLALWNELAARGIPVLMEKPFVLRGELERAARGPDVEPLLMINFNRRFWTPYVRLADLARGGAIGALRTVEVALHVDIAPWCTVTTHRLSADEGGVLYDLGSQALDLVAGIAGTEPVRILARGSSRRWTCDHVRLEVDLAGGIRAVCDLAYEPRTSERVTAVGERGTLVLADPNMALHRVDAGGAALRARRRAADLATVAYYAVRRGRSMARHSITAALASFVTAVRSGAPFSPGFADAVRNAAWLESTRLEVEP